VYRISQNSQTLHRTESRVQIPNFTQIVSERQKSWVKIIYATVYGITVADPTFTKLVLPQKRFAKYYHTELHDNLKNALDADTRSQTDRRTDGCDLHTNLSFSLRNECLKQFGYHCITVFHNECAEWPSNIHIEIQFHCR